MTDFLSEFANVSKVILKTSLQAASSRPNDLCTRKYDMSFFFSTWENGINWRAQLIKEKT